MPNPSEQAKKLNRKQVIALREYAKSGKVKYPHELGVRAVTASALERRGLLKQHFERRELLVNIHDWSKYIITDDGRKALESL